jgi:hypothetical protein
MATSRAIVAVVAFVAAATFTACQHSDKPALPTNDTFRPDPAAGPLTADPAAHGPGSECGMLTYPQTGTNGEVVIVKGETSCADAKAVMVRYLHDASITHTGNTWSAEFDGWLCASPTAAASEEYGYLTSCTRGTTDELQIRRPSAGQTPSATPASGCDSTAISRDMGQQLNVGRCQRDWAYVSTSELGDAQSLLRRVNGTWTRYAGFPTTICRSQADSDGVPGAELSSFPPC